MSSSTFSQRWTSVNDSKTTNGNEKNGLSSFFLRLEPVRFVVALCDPYGIHSRSCQSLISLIESSSTLAPSSSAACPFSDHCHSSSRVAHIVHQFESQFHPSMSNNVRKVSSPIRSVFAKQWENSRHHGFSPRFAPILVVESPSALSLTSPVATTTTTTTRTSRPQPIIICERITNHNRSCKSSAHSAALIPASSLTKTRPVLEVSPHQERDSHQVNVDQAASVANSPVHMLIGVKSDVLEDLSRLSRSSTGATNDSTCSSHSSSSSSSSPSSTQSPPRFARPTIASTQKQRDMLCNLTAFKRSSSPPPCPSVTTFTRVISSFSAPSLPPSSPSLPPASFRRALSSINEDLEQHAQFFSIPTVLYSSDTSPADPYCRLSVEDVCRLEPRLAEDRLTTELLNIDTNRPLKYKRDSLIRLYG